MQYNGSKALASSGIDASSTGNWIFSPSRRSKTPQIHTLVTEATRTAMVLLSCHLADREPQHARTFLPAHLQ